MKRLSLIAVAALLILTLGVSVWQRERLARFLGVPDKSLMGKAGIDALIPKVDYLSPTEKEIIGEMNLARTNPQQYAGFLEEAKKSMSGNRFKLDGTNPATVNEGVKAVDEAIQFLRAAQPLPVLQVSKGMSLGAKDHMKDMTQSGKMGHKGSDGSLPEERVSRYGNWKLAVGENIAYSSSTAREVVLGMIIDDGNPGRGHRLNIFNANHHIAGVAGQPSAKGIVCVVTYAGAFTESAGGAPATSAKIF